MFAERIVPLAVSTAVAIAATRHGLGLSCALAAAALVAFRPSRLLGAAVAAGIILVFARPDVAQFTTERMLNGGAVTITGDVRRDDAGITTIARLPSGERVRAHLSAVAGVAPGDRLIVRGHLVPFDVPRNPGEPSERTSGRDEGLAGTLIVTTLVARAPPDANDVDTWATRLRATAAARLRARVREPEATIVAGALWGERGTLPRDLHDDFRVTGTVHVLVTAGLHLGIVGATVLGCAWLLALPRPLGAGTCALVLVVYTWFSGAHLPSQRACAMALVVLAARALGARPRPGDALGVAAFAVLAIDPGAVESVSFALSFSCVTAIACFAEPVAAALERFRVPHVMREPLALTIATQIGVWPLSATVFGTLAPYAIAANAVVVPLIGIAMPLGALTVAAAPWGWVATVLAQWTTWCLSTIVVVVHGLAALPMAHVIMPPPPLAAVLAYDMLALAAAAALHARRFAIAGISIAIGAAVVVVSAQPALPPVPTITFLDVGQGDGIVIQTPRGHVVMIDAGGRLERGPVIDARSPAERAGERIVLGYLHRRGITRIDLLVLTHPHGDHVGGCAPIVAALRVDALADTAQDYGGRAYTDCMRVVRERNVPVVIARTGLHWASDDGLSLDVLAPSLPLFADTGDDVNENSAIVRATYDNGSGPVRALFTGDAGGASEARLLEARSDVAADILKVGHHGSRFASTPAFVAAVHPAIAVISVGRHNVFGHPAATTLSTLAAGVPSILRTDRCGAISIRLARPLRPATTIPCS